MRQNTPKLNYNQENPITSKRAFIYILWGNPENGIIPEQTKIDIQNQIDKIKTFPNLLKQSLFFSIGKDAKCFLQKQNLVNHIHYSDKNHIHPIKLSIWYQRQMVLFDMLHHFDEIICPDFDCYPVKDPDDEMWDTINKKGGFLNGDIQTAMNAFTKNKWCFEHRRHMKNPYYDHIDYNERIILCCCLTYVRNKELLKGIMDGYHKFFPKLKDYYGDGEYVGYFIETNYGIKSSRWFDENVRCRIVNQRIRNYKLLRNYEDCYFWHKKMLLIIPDVVDDLFARKTGETR